jgi:hypothetical protein
MMVEWTIEKEKEWSKLNKEREEFFNKKDNTIDLLNSLIDLLVKNPTTKLAIETENFSAELPIFGKESYKLAKGKKITITYLV